MYSNHSEFIQTEHPFLLLLLHIFFFKDSKCVFLRQTVLFCLVGGAGDPLPCPLPPSSDNLGLVGWQWHLGNCGSSWLRVPPSTLHPPTSLPLLGNVPGVGRMVARIANWGPGDCLERERWRKPFSPLCGHQLSGTWDTWSSFSEPQFPWYENSCWWESCLWVSSGALSLGSVLVAWSMDLLKLQAHSAFFPWGESPLLPLGFQRALQQGPEISNICRHSGTLGATFLTFAQCPGFTDGTTEAGEIKQMGMFGWGPRETDAGRALGGSGAEEPAKSDSLLESSRGNPSGEWGVTEAMCETHTN